MSIFKELISKDAICKLANAVAEQTKLPIPSLQPPSEKLARLKLSKLDKNEYIAIYRRLSLMPFQALDNTIELFDFYYSSYPSYKKQLLNSSNKILRSVPALFEGFLLMSLQGISCWPEPPYELAYTVKSLIRDHKKLEIFCAPLIGILMRDGVWKVGINSILLDDHLSIILSEHQRRMGHNEQVWKTLHKYQNQLDNLLANPEFMTDWALIKKSFPLSKKYDRYGIIRRTVMPERNWRQDYAPDYQKQNQRFQVVFDFFCWKWGLFGMKGDEPLLEKLSHTVTPYGTQIFIPAYWSFDYARDIYWKKLIKLHRARGVKKQGEKLDSNREQKKKELKKLYRLCQKSRSLELRGFAKMKWIKENMGYPLQMDDAQLRRLIKESSNV